MVSEYKADSLSGGTYACDSEWFLLQPSFPHAWWKPSLLLGFWGRAGGSTVQPNSARPRSLTAVCQWSKYMHTHVVLMEESERGERGRKQAHLIPHLSRKPEQHSCHLSPPQEIYVATSCPRISCSGSWSSRYRARCALSLCSFYNVMHTHLRCVETNTMPEAFLITITRL